MYWRYLDFKKWIDSGCPQDVADTVHDLALHYNNISTLPECVGQLVNLKSLNLSHNNFSTLPECVGQLVNLEWLSLNHNNFSTLPECVGQLIWLKELFLSYNNFSTLPEWFGQLANLKRLYISNNNISTLPECVGQLVNLLSIYLSNNNLSTLPEYFGQLVNLELLDLGNNNFSTLPPVLGNLSHLRHFYYNNNPIDYIPANVFRMINRTKTVQGVYTDSQSVHNSTIQKSILDSVNRLLTIKPICGIDNVMTFILEDPILTDVSKSRLIEYSEDTSVHTLLNITFSEMLVVVWNRILSLDSRDEIKKTLNTEILDAECMCFTGRISRLVNCLTGYDERVVVEIADKEQIGMIIEITRNSLGANYTVEEHKRITTAELRERGYNQEVIDEWVVYIE